MSDWCILTIDNSPLYLADVKRNHIGEVVRGHVVNGAWIFEMTEFEVICKGRDYGGGEYVVTRYPRPKDIKEYAYKRGHHYNSVIDNSMKNPLVKIYNNISHLDNVF